MNIGWYVWNGEKIVFIGIWKEVSFCFSYKRVMIVVLKILRIDLGVWWKEILVW